MKTLSIDEFKKKYGEDTYAKFGVPEKSPGYFGRVGQEVGKTFSGLKSDLSTQNKVITSQTNESPVKEGFKKTIAAMRGGLRITGAAAKTALTPVMEAPGIKQGTEFIGEQLAKTPPLKKYQEWAGRHPEAAKDIENTLDIASLIPIGGGAKVAKPIIEESATKIASGATKAAGKVTSELSELGGKALAATKNTPADIMTRVARLTPKEEIAFKNTAGKTVGEYLVETGNFGDPRKIIEKEAEKFATSKKMVDDALAGLQGEFRVGSVEDALNMLVKKGEATSTSNVKSAYLSRAQELLQKSQTSGLNMSEINEVKRLLEKEVKLGYNKLTKPITIEKATNIDNAIRKWQFEKAPQLGLENLPELNKQTQISKFLLNKLGDSVLGKQALNNINLTDWIVLSGGDPTAVAGFITKKFLSSKSVQAKIAELLNKKEVKGMITPKTTK